MKWVCTWVFLLHRIVKMGYVASQSLLIFVIKPGDLYKRTFKLTKVHYIRLSGFAMKLKIHITERCSVFWGVFLVVNWVHSFLSCKWNVSVWSQGSRAGETGPRQRDSGAGPKGGCPWAVLLPWPELSQEPHLGSCSGTSKDLLVVVWYSCAIGATLEKLEAVFILKATTGSSMYKCLGKTLFWSESINSCTFLLKSIRSEF